MSAVAIYRGAHKKPKKLELGDLLYSSDDDSVVLITCVHPGGLVGSGLRVQPTGLLYSQQVDVRGDHWWFVAPSGMSLTFTQE